MYFYDPKKQIAKYREKKEQQYKAILDASKEKADFIALYEEAKKKLTSDELMSFENKYD